MPPMRAPVWLIDLDDTLHDYGSATFAPLSQAMGEYIERELGLGAEEAQALRRRYWQRYGATLLGLVRHHGVDAHHFLRQTHHLPGLEERVRAHRHDLAVLRKLPGRRVLLTNAPRHYATRVLAVLGIGRCFERIVTIEDMAMFGHLRPKPDARMLRALAARLRVSPARCVLVEDTLAHQKAARGVGMETVWVQRWLGPGRRSKRRPVYVDHRLAGLNGLRRILR
jgi:putative hydrolase of the HAD superfamily